MQENRKTELKSITIYLQHFQIGYSWEYRI